MERLLNIDLIRVIIHLIDNNLPLHFINFDFNISSKGVHILILLRFEPMITPKNKKALSSIWKDRKLVVDRK